MHSDDSPDAIPPRWLHGLAVLTVAVFALPLLFLGAAVTSHDVGMVDARGFRPPWEIVAGLLEDHGFGWRLEYSHRTFGFIVGLCGILLAVSCWFFDSRPWMGGIGFLALALICVQGLLGIFRVDYNATHGRTYAMIHGGFAHLVFATLVCVALFTSRRWASDPGVVATPALRRGSIIAAVLVFAQLVLGGLVRHQKDSLLGPRGHLLGAFVVVGAFVWLLLLIRENAIGSFSRPRILLKVLLVVQLLLGVESWLTKFFVANADLPQLQPLPMHGNWVRTLHYLIGTMIFSTTVVIAVIANRRTLATAEPNPVRSRELEGAI